MAISNLSVVSVPVSDQDRAKAFYVGQLGFTADRYLVRRGHALGDAAPAGRGDQ